MPKNVGYKNARKNTRNPRKNRKNMRKRNPYNAAKKKQTVKMIQPIAEGRRLTFSQTLTPRILGPTVNNENWYVHIPDTWNHMYRENFLDTISNQPSSVGFTGKTLFSRFLNMQVKLKFQSIEHYTVPPHLHVVWGWYKIPYQTALQSTGAPGSNNSNGVLIQHERAGAIARNLAAMYNVMFPVTDPKQFKLMYRKEFQVRGENIEGKDVSDPADVKDVNQVIRKDIKFNISWKPNTKYHMRPATEGNGTDSVDPGGTALKPDDGNADFNTNHPPATTAYWTPSNKNNGDLWTPFFAIQLKNANAYGRDAKGENCVTCYPLMFQQNKHYFYDL